MNTHLQKIAIKKIFSTLTLLINEYDVSSQFIYIYIVIILITIIINLKK